MPDLDYVKVIGRLGIVVRDEAADDPNLEPDTVWCDGGQVQFTPLLTSVKVVGADPVPATLGQSTITGEIDSEGYLTLRGTRSIQLVDLTSTKVNPFIAAGKATHKVEFVDLVADGQPVSLPSPVNVRFSADTADEFGNCDLTLLMPVPVAGGTAQIVGPRGFSAYQGWLAEGNAGTYNEFLETLRGPQGIQGEVGPNNFLVYADGSYPVRETDLPQIFYGPVDPDTLGLMIIGDIWIDSDETASATPAYLRVNEIGSPGTPGGNALDAWFNTKLYEDPADPGTYLIGG